MDMERFRIMRWMAGSCFLAALFASCSADPARSAGEGCEESAAAFWRDFRGAALGANPDAVIPFVRFPLERRSELDEDGSSTLSKEAFSGAFTALLGSDSGLRQEEFPVRAVIQGTEVVKNVKCTPRSGEFDVSLLRFQRTDQGWKLVRIYVNE